MTKTLRGPQAFMERLKLHKPTTQRGVGSQSRFAYITILVNPHIHWFIIGAFEQMSNLGFTMILPNCQLSNIS